MNADNIRIFIIILLVVNLILVSYNLYINNKNKKEKWNNPDLKDDYGQKTYAGCSCVAHGVKNNMNMPFNDDSGLYAKNKYQGY